MGRLSTIKKFYEEDLKNVESLRTLLSQIDTVFNEPILQDEFKKFLVNISKVCLKFCTLDQYSIQRSSREIIPWVELNFLSHYKISDDNVKRLIQEFKQLKELLAYLQFALKEKIWYISILNDLKAQNRENSKQIHKIIKLAESIIKKCSLKLDAMSDSEQSELASQILSEIQEIIQHTENKNMLNLINKANLTSSDKVELSSLSVQIINNGILFKLMLLKDKIEKGLSDNKASINSEDQSKLKILMDALEGQACKIIGVKTDSLKKQASKIDSYKMQFNFEDVVDKKIKIGKNFIPGLSVESVISNFKEQIKGQA